MSKARELAELGNVYSDGALSNRNRIINGNFDVWQRGTSFSVNQPGGDRWYNIPVGSGLTQSRQEFTLGQTDVPNEPTYFCRNVASSVSGNSNLAALQQRIEGVRTFAGQAVTLTFWAKADASKNIAVDLEQNFGSGGSPSSGVSGIGATTCALTTSWQKFTITASLPSISGKTLGTNGNDFLALTLWFDAGSDYNSRTNSLGQQSGTFDIAQVQLEVGDTATPFEHRSYGQELALCQRYFQMSGSVMPTVGGAYGADPFYQHTMNFYSTTDASYSPAITFPVQMRTAPSVTVYPSNLGSGQAINRVSVYASNQAWVNNVAGIQISNSMLTIYSVESGLNGNDVEGFAGLAFIAWTADAEL